MQTLTRWTDPRPLTREEADTIRELVDRSERLQTDDEIEAWIIEFDRAHERAQKVSE